jgi:hypothetical protein
LNYGNYNRIIKTGAIEKQEVTRGAWKAAEIEAKKKFDVAETEATTVWKAEEIAMQERMTMAEVKIMNDKSLVEIAKLNCEAPLLEEKKRSTEEVIHG